MRSRNFAKNFAAVAEFGRGLGRVADVIGNGGALFIRNAGKCLAEAVLRFRFDPQQAGKNDVPIRPLLRIRSADPFVDEIHDADG